MKILLLGAVLFIVACGGRSAPPPTTTPTAPTGPILGTVDPQSASAAAERLQLALMRGESGTAWSMLHTAQQALVSQQAYTACSRGASDVEWQSISVTSESREIVNATGIDGPVNVIRTHERIIAVVPLQESHDWVMLDGQWRWVMDSQSVRLYQLGQCPSE